MPTRDVRVLPQHLCGGFAEPRMRRPFVGAPHSAVSGVHANRHERSTTALFRVASREEVRRLGFAGPGRCGAIRGVLRLRKQILDRGLMNAREQAEPPVIPFTEPQQGDRRHAD